MYTYEDRVVKIVQLANGAAVAGKNDSHLQSRHDLAVEQVEGRYHLIMREVANVKHAHKMRRANLAHLLLELSRH